jgi:DNA-binding transcriptional ArsR family regulator
MIQQYKTVNKKLTNTLKEIRAVKHPFHHNTESIYKIIQEHPEGIRPYCFIQLGYSKGGVEYALKKLLQNELIKKTLGQRRFGEGGRNPVYYKAVTNTKMEDHLIV